MNYAQLALQVMTFLAGGYAAVKGHQAVKQTAPKARKPRAKKIEA